MSRLGFEIFLRHENDARVVLNPGKHLNNFYKSVVDIYAEIHIKFYK